MNEMSVNWGRLGAVVVGLLSLTILAMLVIKNGEADWLIG